MTILAAENSFKKGLAALVENRPAEAVDHFRVAMQMEKERSVRSPEMRYLSYYGLSMARAYGASADSRQACELAARQAPYSPAILLNLARVYEMSGRTTRALEYLARAHALAPEHPTLGRELRRLDRRERPVVARLDRGHALNRSLGRLRSWLRGARRVVEPSATA